MDKHLAAFQHLVANKYQTYNRLFLQLPFAGVPEAGHELITFSDACVEGLAKKLNPEQIIAQYFDGKSDEQKTSTLFLFLQFIERQIVLFDALEDCAFSLTHHIQGKGSLHDTQLDLKALKNFTTRIVLTAHPTQFYAPPVLNIIEDLSSAIQTEDSATIEKLLLQMGKTSFMNPTQPTPIDEAQFLMDYLQRIFYPTLKNILHSLREHGSSHHAPIHLGFWPGGDRDGNPNVTASTTLKVAELLKQRILQCYHQDLKIAQRHLTFTNVLPALERITQQLNNYRSSDALLTDLLDVRTTVLEQHNGLFVDILDDLIAAIRCFGFHFATLDIRQDSSAHDDFMAQHLPGYGNATCKEQQNLIEQALQNSPPHINTDHDVIQAIRTIPQIQHNNGELGCHRYIISNTQSVHHVLTLLLLIRWAGQEHTKLDIVPLFESIEDLQRSAKIMTELFSHSRYQEHLASRNNTQTIMLGFSDGTKDGGYITANWAIYQAKKRLSEVARTHNIRVIFFDGRGGPPARGGGNTNLYYRAQEADIAMSQIQLTIQGQTISTNFGTKEAAQYNMEQLYTAGLIKNRPTLNTQQVQMLDQLSDISAEKYLALKNHPQFLDYLEHATPLGFYGELNIASRPPKRGRDEQLTLNDLRAIPFVGAWSQMKQNVPGYYGVGTALHTLKEQGQLSTLQTMYQDVLFFRTLLDNTAQSLKKSFFPLTEYLASHARYGALWQDIADEAKLTEKMLLEVSTDEQLLAKNPVTRHSIEMRTDIVLPLLVIQQYALMGLQQKNHPDHTVLRKLLLKSMATNINAARNSA